MKMARFALGLAFLTATLHAEGATGQTGQPAGELVIDERSFSIGVIPATGGLPDVGLALGFSRQGGRVVVCAATASTLSGTLQQIKRAMVITEGGTTILRGLQWAPNYPRGTDLVGRVAECQITNHPAPANPDFGFELARTRF